jgi:dihydrofolate reductase
MIGIVAMNQERCIGKGNDLPWHYSADLKLFKKRTLNGTIVMGRNTWDSLPRKPLPKRDNVILTRDPAALREGTGDLPRVHVTDLAGLDQILAGLPTPHFVIGGRQIYELLQDRVDQFWVTLVPDTVEDGDVFFPFPLAGVWKEAERSDLPEGCVLVRYTRP